MKTLILIDDNKDNFQFMKEAFASIDDNIKCVSFIFPSEAIDALLHEMIDAPYAVFMNFNVPGKNATQLIGELRSHEKYEALPVVFYTAKITSHMLESIKDLGVTMTFEKPNTIREWKIVLQGILNSINNSAVNVLDNPSGEVLFQNDFKKTSSPLPLS